MRKEHRPFSRRLSRALRRATKGMTLREIDTFTLDLAIRALKPDLEVHNRIIDNMIASDQKAQGTKL